MNIIYIITFFLNSPVITLVRDGAVGRTESGVEGNSVEYSVESIAVAILPQSDAAK